MQFASVVVMFGLAVSALAVVPPVVKPAQLNAECTLCDIVVPIVAHLLEGEEPDVEGKLDGVCDQIFSWSGVIDTVCKGYINTNLDKIIALINSGTEVSKICAAMHACPATELFAQQVKPVVVAAQDGGFQCTLCTGLVFFIEGLVNGDEPQIKSKLDAYCEELPAFLSSACQALINTELDNILKQLEGNATPAEVCQSLSLCQNMRAAAFVAKQKAAFEARAVKPVKLNKIECDLCDLVIHFVEEDLLSEPEAELVAKLDKLCEKVPVLGSACESYVKQFGDIIQKDLQAGKGSEQICAGLHAC
jgi:hypothetical protein